MSAHQNIKQQDEGTASLLTAVQGFLEQDLLPNLQGYDKYQTRVAINTLKIAERALRLDPKLKQLDESNLPRFGIAVEDGIAALAEKIADNSVSQSPELLTYLKQRTLLQMAINSPKYWGYAQAKKNWEAA